MRLTDAIEKFLNGDEDGLGAQGIVRKCRDRTGAASGADATYRTVLLGRNGFARTAADLPLFGGDVTDMSKADLRRWLASLRRAGLRDVTIDDYWKRLRAFVRWCVKFDLITNEQGYGLETVTPDGAGEPSDAVVVPEWSEVEAVIACCTREADRQAIGLMATAGLRPSELCRLTFAHLAFEARTRRAMLVFELHKSAKKGKRRVVPLGQLVQRDAPEDDDPRRYPRHWIDLTITRRCSELPALEAAGLDQLVPCANGQWAVRLDHPLRGEALFDYGRGRLGQQKLQKRVAAAVRAAQSAGRSRYWTAKALRKHCAVATVRTKGVAAARQRLGHASDKVTIDHYLTTELTAGLDAGFDAAESIG